MMQLYINELITTKLIFIRTFKFKIIDDVNQVYICAGINL